MRRVIGIDLHRTFGEVVIWENGVVRHFGRVDMTRTALEGFGKSLRPTDEVVIEATGNSLAISRVLAPFASRVIIANPLQVKAIAQAHVKTDGGDLMAVFGADAHEESMQRSRGLGRRPCRLDEHGTRVTAANFADAPVMGRAQSRLPHSRVEPEVAH